MDWRQTKTMFQVKTRESKNFLDIINFQSGKKATMMICGNVWRVRLQLHKCLQQNTSILILYF